VRHQRRLDVRQRALLVRLGDRDHRVHVWACAGATHCDMRPLMPSLGQQ
jgi:hypothetical protein